ncbi:MAG: hypothetical protein CVV23_15870 [Ignavibacteriae bacterium HGW-Ignavibacteriae-2]|jgi:hypothetical protein|nr:hypothetical protein [Bacteroidota bacterium]PKL87347.1 MAG: hypothetical protein CVV23_15870 [Ignavibacteriae bacterium HGW-Ignavibacteriae-2]
MEKYKKYWPFFILILFLTLFVPVKESIGYSWFSLLIIFVGIILLFEFIEKSRVNRTKKWSAGQPNKLLHIIKFSLGFGLPLAIIIVLLIYDNAEPLNLAVFIMIPLIVIFGWIGLLDWRNCNKIYLEQKYKVDL